MKPSSENIPHTSGDTKLPVYSETFDEFSEYCFLGRVKLTSAQLSENGEFYFLQGAQRALSDHWRRRHKSLTENVVQHHSSQESFSTPCGVYSTNTPTEVASPSSPTDLSVYVPSCDVTFSDVVSTNASRILAFSSSPCNSTYPASVQFPLDLAEGSSESSDILDTTKEVCGTNDSFEKKCYTFKSIENSNSLQNVAPSVSSVSAVQSTINQALTDNNHTEHSKISSNCGTCKADSVVDDISAIENVLMEMLIAASQLSKPKDCSSQIVKGNASNNLKNNHYDQEVFCNRGSHPVNKNDGMPTAGPINRLNASVLEPLAARSSFETLTNEVLTQIDRTAWTCDSLVDELRSSLVQPPISANRMPSEESCGNDFSLQVSNFPLLLKPMLNRLSSYQREAQTYNFRQRFASESFGRVNLLDLNSSSSNYVKFWNLGSHHTTEALVNPLISIMFEGNLATTTCSSLLSSVDFFNLHDSQLFQKNHHIPQQISLLQSSTAVSSYALQSYMDAIFTILKFQRPLTSPLSISHRANELLSGVEMNSQQKKLLKDEALNSASNPFSLVKVLHEVCVCALRRAYVCKDGTLASKTLNVMVMLALHHGSLKQMLKLFNALWIDTIASTSVGVPLPSTLVPVLGGNAIGPKEKFMAAKASQTVKNRRQASVKNNNYTSPKSELAGDVWFLPPQEYPALLHFELLALQHPMVFWTPTGVRVLKSSQSSSPLLSNAIPPFGAYTFQIVVSFMSDETPLLDDTMNRCKLGFVYGNSQSLSLRHSAGEVLDPDQCFLIFEFYDSCMSLWQRTSLPVYKRQLSDFLSRNLDEKHVVGVEGNEADLKKHSLSRDQSVTKKFMATSQSFETSFTYENLGVFHLNGTQAVALDILIDQNGLQQSSFCDHDCVMSRPNEIVIFANGQHLYTTNLPHTTQLDTFLIDSKVMVECFTSHGVCVSLSSDPCWSSAFVQALQQRNLLPVFRTATASQDVDCETVHETAYENVCLMAPEELVHRALSAFHRIVVRTTRELSPSSVLDNVELLELFPMLHMVSMNDFKSFEQLVFLIENVCGTLKEIENNCFKTTAVNISGATFVKRRQLIAEAGCPTLMILETILRDKSETLQKCVSANQQQTTTLVSRLLSCLLFVLQMQSLSYSNKKYDDIFETCKAKFDYDAVVWLLHRSVFQIFMNASTFMLKTIFWRATGSQLCELLDILSYDRPYEASLVVDLLHSWEEKDITYIFVRRLMKETIHGANLGNSFSSISVPASSLESSKDDNRQLRQSKIRERSVPSHFGSVVRLEDTSKHSLMPACSVDRRDSGFWDIFDRMMLRTEKQVEAALCTTEVSGSECTHSCPFATQKKKYCNTTGAYKHILKINRSFEKITAPRVCLGTAGDVAGMLARHAVKTTVTKIMGRLVKKDAFVTYGDSGASSSVGAPLDNNSVRVPSRLSTQQMRTTPFDASSGASQRQSYMVTGTSPFPSPLQANVLPSSPQHWALTAIPSLQSPAPQHSWVQLPSLSHGGVTFPQFTINGSNQPFVTQSQPRLVTDPFPMMGITSNIHPTTPAVSPVAIGARGWIETSGSVSAHSESCNFYGTLDSNKLPKSSCSSQLPQGGFMPSFMSLKDPKMQNSCTDSVFELLEDLMRRILLTAHNLLGGMTDTLTVSGGLHKFVYSGCSIGASSSPIFLEGYNFLQGAVLPCITYLTVLTDATNNESAYKVGKSEHILVLKLLLKLWPLILRLSLRSLLFLRQMSTCASQWENRLHPVADTCVAFVALAGHFIMWLTSSPNALSISSADELATKNDPGVLLPFRLLNGARYLPADSNDVLKPIESSLRSIILTLLDCSTRSSGGFMINNFSLPRSMSEFLKSTQPCSEDIDHFKGCTRKDHRIKSSKMAEPSNEGNTPISTTDTELVTPSVACFGNTNACRTRLHDSTAYSTINERGFTVPCNSELTGLSQPSSSSEFIEATTFVRNLLLGNEETKKLLGAYWKPFHPNLCSVQLAITAVMLHLIGFENEDFFTRKYAATYAPRNDASALGTANFSAQRPIRQESVSSPNGSAKCFSSGIGMRQLRQACQLGRKATMKLLAEMQKRLSSCGKLDSENENLLKPVDTIAKRDSMKKSVIQRCQWIIDISPRGLCGSSGLAATQGWDDYLVSMRRSSFNAPAATCRSLSCAEPVFCRPLLKYMTVSHDLNVPPSYVGSAEHAMVLRRKSGGCRVNRPGLLKRSVTRNLDVLKKLLSHRRVTFDNHAVLARTSINPEVDADGNRIADIGLNVPKSSNKNCTHKGMPNGSGSKEQNVDFNSSKNAIYETCRGDVLKDKISDLETETLGHFLDFVIRGPDVKIAEKVLKAEQLASLCRYVTLRSMKALVLAGLCGRIASIRSFGKKRQREATKEINESGGNDIIKEDFTLLKMRRHDSSASASHNSVASVSGESFERVHSSNYLGLIKGSSVNMSKDNTENAELQTVDRSGVETSRTTYWPILLDLLVPSIANGASKNAQSYQPTAAAVRLSGWLLFKFLHESFVQLRAVKPVTPLRATQSQESSNSSEDTGLFWKFQPFSDAISVSMSEIVRTVCDWHLRYNHSLITALVGCCSSGLCQTLPCDEFWMESVLRYVTLNICLRTRPLDDCRYIVPVMHHMLTVAHPQLHRLLQKDLDTALCVAGNGKQSILQTHPLSECVALRKAVCAVLIKRVQTEHCNQNLLLDSNEYTISEKHIHGAYTWLLCTQYYENAPSFTVPSQDLTNVRFIFDETNPSQMSWLLTGHAASEPDGREQVVCDAKLDICTETFLKQSRENLENQNYACEATLGFAGETLANVWVLRKALVYQHALSVSNAGKEDETFQVTQKFKDGSSTSVCLDGVISAELGCYSEAADRLRLTCWQLFRAVLWGVMVSSESNEGAIGETTALAELSGDYECTNGWNCSLISHYVSQSQIDNSERRGVMEAVVKMVISVLVRLTAAMHTTYSTTAKSPFNGIDSIFTSNDMVNMLSSEEVDSTEQFISDILTVLYNCVMRSSSAALVVLKSLMTAENLQTVHLEPMFRCSIIKSSLYKLVTGCIRQAPSDHNDIGYSMCIEGMGALPYPQYLLGSNLRLNSSLLLHCLPPLQIVPVGCLIEAVSKLVIKPDELSDSSGLPINFGENRSSSVSSFGGPSGKNRDKSLSSETLGRRFDSGGRDSMRLVQNLPPVPMPPRRHPFDDLPQSEIFLSSRPSADFECEVDGRQLRITRAQNLGGVVLCRAPLTFPSLITSASQPNDIITIRLQTAGRFGVTVAPAECVLCSTSEVFERNDVVGFKTNHCPSFWQEIFAASVAYEEGDLLDVTFNVEDQTNGQRCLRTELMVSGESIGSVLEVFFENESQVEQERRMNLVFIFQDPMTILYEGPSFALTYVDPNAACEPNSTQLALADTDIETEPEDEEIRLWKSVEPLFTEAMQLYQAILTSDNRMVQGLKNEVINDICTCIRTAINSAQDLLNYINVREVVHLTNTNSYSSRTHSLQSENLCSGVSNSGNENFNTVVSANCTSGSTTPADIPEDNMVACRHAFSALAVIGCDLQGNGQLKEILLQDQNSNRRHNCADFKKGYTGLPWLIGSSNLRRAVAYGLTIAQCEQLLCSLVDMLTTPLLCQALFTVAKSGVVKTNLQNEMTITSVILALSTKALLACCLIVRNLVELHPEGLSSPSLEFMTAFRKLLKFAQNFCFCSAGVNSDTDALCFKSNSQQIIAVTNTRGAPCNPNLHSSNSDFVSDSSTERFFNTSNAGSSSATAGTRFSFDDFSTKKDQQTAYVDMEQIATLCGIPSQVVRHKSLALPAIVAQPVISVEDTSKLWKWMRVMCKLWHEVCGGAGGPVEHLDGSINVNCKVESRVFNYEGSSSLTSKRLAGRMNETAFTWSLKKDVIEMLCAMAALVPEEFVSELSANSGSLQSVSTEVIDADCSGFSGCFLASSTLNMMRLFRMCIYFISREKDDNIPDYWYQYRQQIENKSNRREVFRVLNRESVIQDKLYGWQRVFYIALTDKKYSAMQKYFLEILQTETLYHLIGSMAQIISNKTHHQKSPKYCSLSPSVYVAHWFLDSFVRHPLCPSDIRRSLFPISWSPLFALLLNGCNLPMKLALDAARVTFWMTGSVPLLNPWRNHSRTSLGVWDSVDNLNGKMINNNSLFEDESRESTQCMAAENLPVWQSIFECICYCGTSVLYSMEESSCCRRVSWDCFTCADMNRQVNRHRLNSGLLVHYLSAAAAVMKRSDVWDQLKWLPHLGCDSFKQHVTYLCIADRIANLTSRVATISFEKKSDRVPGNAEFNTAAFTNYTTEESSSGIIDEPVMSAYPMKIIRSELQLPRECEVSASLRVDQTIGRIKGSGYIIINSKSWWKNGKLVEYIDNNIQSCDVFRSPKIIFAADRLFHHAICELYQRPLVSWGLVATVEHNNNSNLKVQVETNHLKISQLCLSSNPVTVFCNSKMICGSASACITLTCCISSVGHSLDDLFDVLSLKIGVIDATGVDVKSMRAKMLDEFCSFVALDMNSGKFVAPKQFGLLPKKTYMLAENIRAAFVNGIMRIKITTFDRRIMWELDGKCLACHCLPPNFREILPGLFIQVTDHVKDKYTSLKNISLAFTLEPYDFDSTMLPLSDAYYRFEPSPADRTVAWQPFSSSANDILDFNENKSVVSLCGKQIMQLEADSNNLMVGRRSLTASSHASSSCGGASDTTRSGFSTFTDAYTLPEWTIVPIDLRIRSGVGVQVPEDAVNLDNLEWNWLSHSNNHASENAANSHAGNENVPSGNRNIASSHQSLMQLSSFRWRSNSGSQENSKNRVNYHLNNQEIEPQKTDNQTATSSENNSSTSGVTKTSASGSSTARSVCSNTCNKSVCSLHPALLTSTIGMKSVHPAQTFQFSTKFLNISSSDSVMVGVLWGSYRWLWLNDGRFICPAEIPAYSLIPRKGKVTEVQITQSVPLYCDKDKITIDFQPSIPALLFYKNDQYEFGFNFELFYSYKSGKLGNTLRRDISTSRLGCLKLERQNFIEKVYLSITHRDPNELKMLLSHQSLSEPLDLIDSNKSLTFAAVTGLHVAANSSACSFFGTDLHETPLKVASRVGCDECVRHLIELAGANPDGVADIYEGSTPLMIAAQYGHKRVIARLVCVYGANINKKDGYGNTALHRALMFSERLNGRMHICTTVKLLLRLGADVTIKNNQGLTPADVSNYPRECNKVALRSIISTWHQLVVAKAAGSLHHGLPNSACAGRWAGLLANCLPVIGFPTTFQPTTNANAPSAVLESLFLNGDLWTPCSSTSSSSCNNTTCCHSAVLNNTQIETIDNDTPSARTSSLRLRLPGTSVVGNNATMSCTVTGSRQQQSNVASLSQRNLNHLTSGNLKASSSNSVLVGHSQRHTNSPVNTLDHNTSLNCSLSSVLVETSTVGTFDTSFTAVASYGGIEMPFHLEPSAFNPSTHAPFFARPLSLVQLKSFIHELLEPVYRICQVKEGDNCKIRSEITDARTLEALSKPLIFAIKKLRESYGWENPTPRLFSGRLNFVDCGRTFEYIGRCKTVEQLGLCLLDVERFIHWLSFKDDLEMTHVRESWLRRLASSIGLLKCTGGDKDLQWTPLVASVPDHTTTDINGRLYDAMSSVESGRVVVADPFSDIECGGCGIWHNLFKKSSGAGARTHRQQRNLFLHKESDATTAISTFHSKKIARKESIIDEEDQKNDVASAKFINSSSNDYSQALNNCKNIFGSLNFDFTEDTYNTATILDQSSSSNELNFFVDLNVRFMLYEEDKLIEKLHKSWPLTLDLFLKQLTDRIDENDHQEETIASLICKAAETQDISGLISGKNLGLWQKTQISVDEVHAGCKNLYTVFGNLYEVAKLSIMKSGAYSNCGSLSSLLQVSRAPCDSSSNVTSSQFLSVLPLSKSLSSSLQQTCNNFSSPKNDSKTNSISSAQQPSATSHSATSEQACNASTARATTPHLKRHLSAKASDKKPFTCDNIVTKIFTQIVTGRLKLLRQVNACAKEVVPVIAAVYNMPTGIVDEYGIMTLPSDKFFESVNDAFLPWADHNNKKSHMQKVSRHPGYLRSSKKTVLHVGPLDLPVEMSVYLFMKPLLQIETVKNLWTECLEHLGQGVQERPSIRIDRGIAATAKNIMHTMWYQTTQQLLEIYPNKLRGKHSDRPFMVVFRGEGATDFGGPFQEFLSCMAREVMGQLADTPDKSLPTYSACIPCPNFTHSIGSHQDTVVLNPATSSYHPEPPLYAGDNLIVSPLSFDALPSFSTDTSNTANFFSGSSSFCFGENSKDVNSQISAVPSNFRSASIQSSWSFSFAMPNIDEEESFLHRDRIAQQKLKNDQQILSQNHLLEIDSRNNNNYNSSSSSSNIRQLALASTDNNSSEQTSNELRDGNCGNFATLQGHSYYNNAVDGRISYNNSSAIHKSSNTDRAHPSGRRSGNTSSSNNRNSSRNALVKSDAATDTNEKSTMEVVELAMYESLGRVMSMCLCIATAFNITFNPVIWKRIVAAPVSLQDLNDADCVAVEMLRSLKMLASEGPSAWDEQVRQSLGDLTFQTEDSAGNLFELVDGGSEIPVTPVNLPLFIRLSERCRLIEGQKGLESLLYGMGSVIPLGRLRMLFDYRQMEYLICGDQAIDVETLKEHTATTDESLKLQLFEVLENFTNEQLQSFLRFVSGRSRLPTSRNDWRLTVDWDIPEGYEGGPERYQTAMDRRLPTALTCGFRLLIPLYSSVKIMRERLLYAISNCTAIDLDAYVVHEQMQLMYE